MWTSHSLYPLFYILPAGNILRICWSFSKRPNHLHALEVVEKVAKKEKTKKQMKHKKKTNLFIKYKTQNIHIYKNTKNFLLGKLWKKYP